MVLLQSDRLISRKHHVSRRAKIVAEKRIVAAGVGFKFFIIRSMIAHYLALLRNFDGATSNPSEGEGHTFESCRVRHFRTEIASAIARKSRFSILSLEAH
ncbi:hypothetical protein EZH22_12205 [Xanthobacter dioxanivorans]|uniref:Uncharacterized protein n=1 Tax=Xanthobacter dioxanivorans TaxID=2528964 RepID=A0A974PT27_9HYPH|nr:hypothetical protein [Xanthobacter dioxanivorans]QRG08961.1 hypothetical protein EZH22_12205 [Xanthobacter dioxanivorans]